MDEASQYPLYFEDYQPGTAIRTSTRVVTEADLDQYVKLAGFDEDLFVSEAAAAASAYGTRIVPGSMTFAFAEGLVVGTGAIRGVGIAFVGVNDLRIPRPVRPSDEIRVVADFVEKRMSAHNPSVGVVTTRNHVLNQQDEMVMDFDVVRLIQCRS